MIKLISTLVLVPALTLASVSNGHELSWLVGCWVTPNKSAQEVWVADSNRTLAGFGVAVSDNKVGFYEVLSIRRSEDGSWIYTAHPSGQAPASFAATEITNSSVVFANPDHDYPQEIRYVKKGNHLYATISLLGGANPNSFSKVSCD